MVSLEKTMDWIAAVLTTILLECFVRFDQVDLGGSIYIVLTVAIFLLRTRGSCEVGIESFYIFNGIMILFVALSSLWAWSAAESMGTARHMFRSFLYFVLLYLAYKNDKDCTQLFSCFKWAGYLEALYQFKYYGINNLLHMLTEARKAENGAEYSARD